MVRLANSLHDLGQVCDRSPEEPLEKPEAIPMSTPHAEDQGVQGCQPIGDRQRGQPDQGLRGPGVPEHSSSKEQARKACCLKEHRGIDRRRHADERADDHTQDCRARV